MSTLDLFGSAPAKPRRIEAPLPAVVLTNPNGAMRCRAPGCGADAHFAFGLKAQFGVWTCAAHQRYGEERLHERA